MSTRFNHWPRTLTSGPLAGRRFSSERAYRQALGEARLRQWLTKGATEQLEGLLTAHDEATEAERCAARARGQADAILARTAKRLVDAALH